ncbi:hypothetical protein KN1_27340 [Stygiolobus caldivivus]|uniref:Uncharacterized protein n=1 Tax=Stygiolobus caldivivus TaxID=2824673 RepID=A0A8D5U9J5_9CREN|nr:hypothetical protein KN1_27340 [Stygiolobus caldivivus]
MNEIHLPRIVVVVIHFLFLWSLSFFVIEAMSKLFFKDFSVLRGVFSSLFSLMICSLIVTLTNSFLGLVIAIPILAIVFRAIYSGRWVLLGIMSSFYVFLYFLYFEYLLKLTSNFLV